MRGALEVVHVLFGIGEHELQLAAAVIARVVGPSPQHGQRLAGEARLAVAPRLLEQLARKLRGQRRIAGPRGHGVTQPLQLRALRAGQRQGLDDLAVAGRRDRPRTGRGRCKQQRGEQRVQHFLHCTGFGSVSSGFGGSKLATSNGSRVSLCRPPSTLR